MVDMILAALFMLSSMMLYYRTNSDGKAKVKAKTRSRIEDGEYDKYEYEYNYGEYDDDFVIYGNSNFQRTVQQYIQTLKQSKAGRRVWQEAGLRSISPVSGVVSYGGDGSIELNTGLFGYGIFCHELRHVWQDTTGFEGGGLARERDANLWQAARSFEAGYLIDGLVGLFMAFDPLTAAVNAAHYGDQA